MRTKSLIRYQCWTSIKPLAIFYAFFYCIALVIILLVTNLIFAKTGDGNFKAIETSCMIYLIIFGSLGFSEDFKMGIQNSFTRKQIFTATLGMFGFVTLLMSILDTAVSHLFQQIIPNYETFFQQVYGYDHSIFIQWFVLFLLYFMMTISSYFATLICNKVGKKTFFIALIGIGLVLVFVVPLLISRFVPLSFITNVLDVLSKLFTFQHGFYPLITFTCIIALFTGLSFVTVKHTELK